MRYIFLFIITIILAIPFSTEAQRWKRFRYEAIFGIGATNFLGELGGANQIGTNYVRDLELLLTRPVFNLSLRYRTGEYTFMKFNTYYGWVRGDDKLTDEFFRNNRNLNFRSSLFEFSGQFEFSFKSEQIGHKYKLRGVRGRSNLQIFSYGFVGLGGFYFQPKGKDREGNWIKLKPLLTEGQTLIPTRDKYSSVQFVIPFGIGFKYALDKQWVINLEIGAHKSFTDYIDDVSSSYFDNDRLRELVGDKAAEMADPSLNRPSQQTAPGAQRGDRLDKDIYMFAVLSVNYKLRTTRNNLPSF